MRRAQKPKRPPRLIPNKRCRHCNLKVPARTLFCDDECEQAWLRRDRAWRQATEHTTQHHRPPRAIERG